MKNVLLIGATGDVGQGICAVLMRAGFRVIGASRNPQNLAALKARLARLGEMETLVGTVATEAGAIALREAALKLTGSLDVVVTTVNTGKGEPALPLLQLSAEQVEAQLRGNLIPHFVAAKTFIPALVEGGVYLSIGGGMADIIVPGSGVASMAQAAQRNMLRMISREGRGGPVHVRELLLYSVIAGESNRAQADPAWFTDEECGRHVLAVISQPEVFKGPILALKSKQQVGQPEAVAEK